MHNADAVEDHGLEVSCSKFPFLHRCDLGDCLYFTAGDSLDRRGTIFSQTITFHRIETAKADSKLNASALKMRKEKANRFRYESHDHES